jgi:hypothetical protein
MLTTAPDLFGRRDVVGWDTGEVSVVVAEKARVDDLIRRLHYSGSVVWSSSVHLLVYVGGDVVGALQFGPAMNPQSGARIVRGATADSWLELNRMAFVAERPENCGTRAISAAIRCLRHIRPSVEWIQSFADERCQKFGAVYQAASFLYCGEHRSTFYELDGEWFHKSAWNRAPVDKRGWGCGPKLERFNRERDRATRVEFRQFRYIRCLTRRARKNLLLPVLPYPKPDRKSSAA